MSNFLDTKDGEETGKPMESVKPSYEIVAEITMPRGMPGFFAERKFALLDLGDDYRPYMVLRSLTSELALIVVEPRFVVDDYPVHVDDYSQSLLGVEGAEECIVFLIVTLQSGGMPSVNMLGPLVVNSKNKLAAQVVQVDSSYSVNHPVTLALRAEDRKKL